VIREAASVILLRRATRGFEVFFVRRHRGASFMASAYVFPGGAVEPGEDARQAAVRELHEEANVVLPAEAELAPWSHWITPSIEPKRFSARFFVAELPAGQEPRFDATETVDQAWATPADAIARAGELQLPPPQLRTCWELARLANESIRDVLAAGHARASEPHEILPRLLPGAGVCLVLPWDPDYARGTGEAAPMTIRPRWASGPSRFVLEDGRWSHIEAPGSTTTG
jgi:8-oxo-dGTP pyrophosphatase MutT (NUDIX family)